MRAHRTSTVSLHAPPPGYTTHCEGRYVKLESDKYVRWVPHENDDYYVIPANTPMHPKHWVGCALPGAHEAIQSIDEIRELFAKHRLDGNLPFEAGEPFRTDWTPDLGYSKISFDDIFLATDGTPLRIEKGAHYMEASFDPQTGFDPLKLPFNGYEPPEVKAPDTSLDFSGTTLSPLSTSEERKSRTS